MIFEIKSLLKKWADKSNTGNLIYQIARSHVSRMLLVIMSDEAFAKWYYKKQVNKELDLKNPKYFDEKLWWLKYNNRDPLLTKCSDKYAVREYVTEAGYEEILIPQMGPYKNAKDIPFDSFKTEMVIKCNSGSGENYFFNPGESPQNLKKVIKRFNYSLKQNPYWFSREWNYKNIKPCLIAEKVLRDKQGKLPLDYKFFCFDGVPRMMSLDLGLIGDDYVYNHGYPRNIYDMDFNLLPVKEFRENSKEPIEKPENWDKMVKIAETLSAPFPFARIDLYNIDGKIYFGEITFYHGSGCSVIEPEEWDIKMGSWIDLNSDKIIKNEEKKG